MDNNKTDRRTNDTDDGKQGYGFMALLNENGDLQPNDQNKIPQVEHSKELLLHVLYCASHTTCKTLEEAEGWYEPTLFKFHASGIFDSSVYCVMYDRDNRYIEHTMNNNGYWFMFTSTIQTIHNCNQDVMEGLDLVLPVSFCLIEDASMIPLIKQEQPLLTVLKTSCVFMNRYCLIHWCNRVIILDD